MSYDERDAAMDEMYERIGDELNRSHRAQAIDEGAKAWLSLRLLLWAAGFVCFARTRIIGRAALV
ncbi:hypothetical protein WS97_00355 [Burkholderia territorii]|nr:hypothetical protein WS97_00355 [Burkholderia territorii]